ncbi:MAG: hypothetical protein ACQEQ4_08780 [Fibrobacterota bacterium]
MDASQVKELAARYVEEKDMQTIPDPGGLFYILHSFPGDTESGEVFGGYGIVRSYEADESAQPVGKWIFLRYLSLASFPPKEAELKLQPPHIALGRFQSPDRTVETRLIFYTDPEQNTPDDQEADEDSASFFTFKK